MRQDISLTAIDRALLDIMQEEIVYILKDVTLVLYLWDTLHFFSNSLIQNPLIEYRIFIILKTHATKEEH